MRRTLIALLPAAALSLVAVPVFAQTFQGPYPYSNDVYPSGGGVSEPYGTYTPAPSAGYPSPLGIIGAPLAVAAAPFAAVGAGFAPPSATYGYAPRRTCGVFQESTGGGRYTAVCGP